MAADTNKLKIAIEDKKKQKKKLSNKWDISFTLSLGKLICTRCALSR